MRAIGGDYTWNYVTRFGFDKSQLPNDLTLALGTAELSPLQVAIGYSTFANGGFKVSRRTTSTGSRTRAGKVLHAGEPGPGLRRVRPRQRSPAAKGSAARPARVLRCSTRRRTTARRVIPAKNLAPQIIRPQIAYLLADMMTDVIRRGTGMRARIAQSRRHCRQDRHDQRSSRCLVQRLQRRSGHHGLDRIRSGPHAGRRRGRRARGGADLDLLHARGAGRCAARHGVPVPDGIVTVRISPETGLLASSDNPNGIMEKFIEGNLPKSEVYEGPNNSNPNDGDKPLF